MDQAQEPEPGKADKGKEETPSFEKQLTSLASMTGVPKSELRAFIGNKFDVPGLDNQLGLIGMVWGNFAFGGASSNPA
jgi:hypothetical protein